MNVSRPAWFESAIAQPYQSEFLQVAGCPIHYQSWGDPQRPALVFLHGNGAHAHWWDFIAPSFAQQYYVVAYDLSGMGDSGHREHYTPQIYADEVAGVVKELPLSGKPLLIGHSFGARVVFKALQTYPELFAGVIMADAPFSPPDHRFDFHKRRQKPVKPHRIYSSLAEAKQRFRLFPEQPCDNSYIVDYIAEHSAKLDRAGWTWKFDPKIYSTFDYEGLLSTQPRAGDKVLAMIYGEHSTLYVEKTRRYNEELFKGLGLPAPICIPAAHHHLLLDQPLAFIDAIQGVLNQHAFGDQAQV